MPVFVFFADTFVGMPNDTNSLIIFMLSTDLFLYAFQVHKFNLSYELCLNLDGYFNIFSETTYYSQLEHYLNL